MAMTRACGREGVGSQCRSWWGILVGKTVRESGCGRLSAPPLDKVRFPASGNRMRRGGREERDDFAIGILSVRYLGDIYVGVTYWL